MAEKEKVAFSDVKKAISEVLKKSHNEKQLKKMQMPDGKPISSYTLIYQSDINQLEPIYYWLLDFISDAKVITEKLIDNFMSSPGSGHFSEMGQKASVMQQQATKILADTNTLVKTILNLIYDLKEFEIRIKQYEKANSKDKKEQEEGILALKNIWLDQVDLKRQRGSIHMMSAEMGFTTLREAFLVANSIEDINKMASKDGVINDSVKRILIPRISEFLLWKEMSEKEIRKRFEIEKSYLKSEVESLKLYTRWASPYLKAAKDLQMKGFEKSAALVSAFSTTMFELTLFGQREKSISRDEILKKRFYEDRVNPLKTDRQYFEVFVITLKYRGHLGQKAGQGSQSGYAFAFGGRVDITFDCYALNSEEIELTKKYVANSEVGELLSLVSDNTQTALDQLKDDIEKYTSDKEEEKKEEEKKSNDNTNPFEALFELFKGNLSFGKENKKGQKIEKPEEIKKDSFVEEAVREKAGESAKKFLFTIYDVYKKAHRMASSPDNFDN